MGFVASGCFRSLSARSRLLPFVRAAIIGCSLFSASPSWACFGELPSKIPPASQQPPATPPLPHFSIPGCLTAPEPVIAPLITTEKLALFVRAMMGDPLASRRLLFDATHPRNGQSVFKHFWLLVFSAEGGAEGAFLYASWLKSAAPWMWPIDRKKWWMDAGRALEKP